MGMTPEPVLWPTWQAALGNHRSVEGSLIEYVDANGTSVQHLAQRAKPPSAGGNMVAYSSSAGKKLPLPALAWLSEAKASFAIEASSEELPGKGAHPDMVAWRLDRRRVCMYRY